MKKKVARVLKELSKYCQESEAELKRQWNEKVSSGEITDQSAELELLKKNIGILERERQKKLAEMTSPSFEERRLRILTSEEEKNGQTERPHQEEAGAERSATTDIKLVRESEDTGLRS